MSGHDRTQARSRRAAGWPVDLVVGDGCRLRLERDDVHHTAALQDVAAGAAGRSAQSSSRETAASRSSSAVLPAAPAGDGRQECFDVLLFELRLGPPARGATCVQMANQCGGTRDSIRLLRGWAAAGVADEAGLPCCRCRFSSACSYAFLRSSLRQVIVACSRSLSRYLSSSA